MCVVCRLHIPASRPQHALLSTQACTVELLCEQTPVGTRDLWVSSALAAPDTWGTSIIAVPSERRSERPW